MTSAELQAKVDDRLERLELEFAFEPSPWPTLLPGPELLELVDDAARAHPCPKPCCRRRPQ